MTVDSTLRSAIVGLSPSLYYPCDEENNADPLIALVGTNGTVQNGPQAQWPVTIAGRPFGVGRRTQAALEQYIQTAGFSHGTWTGHFIVRCDGGGGDIWMRDITPSAGNIPLWRQTSTNWRARWDGVDTGDANFGSAPPWFDTGEWHQIIVRKNGATVDWWVDGVLVWTQTGRSTAANTTAWRFGRNGTATGDAPYANGGIAHWALWNSALSNDDIALLITSVFGLVDLPTIGDVAEIGTVAVGVGPTVAVATIGDVGVVGGGPSLRAEDEPVRWQMGAELVGHGPLEQSFARAWHEQISEPGIGRLSLSLSDPAAQLVSIRDLVRFSIDGIPRFTMIVEDIEATTIAPGEEHDQVMVVSGRGLLAEWERAPILPPGGPGRQPFSDFLVFNWAHPAIDISAWPTAHPQWQVGIGAPGFMPATNMGAKVNTPLGFPDPHAQFIWGTPAVGTPPAQPPGINYFAGGVGVAEETRVSIYCAGDDAWELWLDGVPIGANREVNGWRETFRADTTLSPGAHRFAAKVTNFERANQTTNVAGFVLAIYAQDGDGNDTTLLQRTNFLWRALPYPAAPPGFTDGHIIRLLLEEAQVAGFLTGWTLSFSDAADSAGNPWPIRTETTFRVGDNLLAALRQLGETNIEFGAAPNARVLHAWNSGGRGTNRPGVVLTPGQNLIRLGHRERG